MFQRFSRPAQAQRRAGRRRSSGSTASRGRQPYCGPTGGIGGLWDSIQGGALVPDLWRWGVQEMRTNPLWQRKMTPEETLYLGRVLFSVGIGFLPGVGDVYDAISGAIGYDLITGEKLALWERGLALAPFVGVGVGVLAAFLADAGRVAGGLDTARDIARGTGWLADDEWVEQLIQHGDAGDLLRTFGRGDEVGDIARAPGWRDRIRRGIEDIRFGVRAWWESGILPHHAVRIRNYAEAEGLTIAFRRTKRRAAIWNLLGFPGKKPTIKTKSNALGIATKPGLTWWERLNPRNWHRSDYDLAVILKQGEVLEEGTEMKRIVKELNEAIGSKQKQILHPTWWTWDRAFVPPPGGMYVFEPQGNTKFFSSFHEMRDWAFERGVHWPLNWDLTKDGVIDPDYPPGLPIPKEKLQ